MINAGQVPVKQLFRRFGVELLEKGKVFLEERGVLVAVLQGHEVFALPAGGIQDTNLVNGLEALSLFDHRDGEPNRSAHAL